MSLPKPSFRPAAARLVAGLLAWCGAPALCAADFPLVRGGQAAPLVVDAADFEVVRLAAADLAGDIATITGITPAAGPTAPAGAPARVLIGTLGHSAAIDALAADGRLDAGELRGRWETFLIATVGDDLVIAGSDRRGTAFGVYELSRQLGVSPWHWWADVPPVRRAELTVPAGTRRFGPPTVKYRGIFLNDEDWGLQPWAAQTFEPENGGIGPRTHEKVCALLLRLKANTLWPAMHACTRPFNADPRNAAVADRYAIVQGSSHAEPMLRNNVGEWTAPKPDYNYVTNRDGVRAYWAERVRSHAGYEAIWTLGMRGIHDSGIQGAKTDAERIAVLTQVFADQHALLAAPAGPDLAARPRMFCAYKEVLDLYRQGLAVPDDVTIVWPDDNFGYVRNFAAPAARSRAGGFGVYYHLSYLGRPLAYLWLNTTPPALIWSEMTRALAHGADRIWIANVGDLKPAEIGTEFFLRLAWEPSAYGPDAQPVFLREWAAREFGAQLGPGIGRLLDDFYTLNFARKPEHLQWNLPGQPWRPSDFTDAEVTGRLAAFADLRARAAALARSVPADRQDAFFELVAYPVHGAALANARYFLGERGETDAALAADTELRELNRRYNEDIAGGKWRHFLRLEPADADWKSMRIAPWAPPAAPRPPVSAPAGQFILPASAGQRTAGATGVAGLGRSGQAVALEPGGHLIFALPATDQAMTLRLELLPTHPTTGDSHVLEIRIDDEAPLTLTLPVDDGGPAWAQGVLAGFRPLEHEPLPPSSRGRRLQVSAPAGGVVLDRLVLTPHSP